MEVFLYNVPPSLTTSTLEKELRQYMNTLGIIEWSCYSKSNKNLGWITFLHPKDGAKFLGRHGKQTLPNPDATRNFTSGRSGSNTKRLKAKSNLCLMNSDVFATESKKKPDPFVLKSLRDNLQDKYNERNKPSRRDALSFSVGHLACGHNSFDNARTALTFIEQFRFNEQGRAKFCKKMIVIKFDQGTKIEMLYSSIVEMIHSSSPCVFTLVLREPPRFYRSNTEQYELQEALAGFSIGLFMPPQKELVRCVSIPNADAHVKFSGTCLVYQLSVFDPDFDQKMTNLDKKRLFNIVHYQISLNKFPSFRREDYQSAWARFYDCLTDAGKNNTLSFGTLYQLQSLVWNNLLHPRSACKLLLLIEKISRKAKAYRNPEPISEQAIKCLQGGIPFACHDADPKHLDPNEISRYLFEVENRLVAESEYRDVLKGEISANHALIFKATVTPTRITLHGPDIEPKNRILRKFANHTDFFMRVTFCDEDGGNLFFNPQVSNDRIFDRYRDVLNKGIPVAGRVYQFLGFSHSSLRSHSAWFSATFVDGEGKLQFPAKIIKSLGYFNSIQIPAKCAARIGQAFSDTPTFISLLENNIKTRNIPDVVSHDGTVKRVFSDGVGTISQDALELIWPRLLRGSRIPTCLQIRWGGVKGMLSLDSRIPGRVICIRKESMEKFPSKDVENLEICDAASKPLRLVLNRQMIKIMEDRGVEKDFFLRLQKVELDRLRSVTADAENTAAFLQKQGIGSSFFLSNLISSLERHGIDYRRDDFLRPVVEAIVLRELRLLKHKARIPVPKGVTLFGIMDETRFLKENEVYVCYDTGRQTGRAPMENSLRDGEVLVTRSPALHPGDIQKAVMRTPPSGHPLRDLRNCIVFSQVGKRDLPSKLSGGDLDGDLYNIIWDEQGIPPTTHKAAKYPRVTPKPIGREVQSEDMAKWFVDFMKSDVLGMIATRHLILSDRDPKGTMGEDCLKLAELHSTAVDFSKTGIPVNPSEIPKAPKARPDFLAPAPPAQLHDHNQIDFIEEIDIDDDEDDASRPDYVYYKSDKVLGELYRNVNERQIWDEEIRRDTSKTGPSVWEQFVGIIQRKIEDYTEGRIVWETKKAEAQRLRGVYDDTITTVTRQYSDNYRKPLTEVEVFCGSIFNKSGSQTRQQKDNSKKLKQEFDRLSALMMQQMRRRFRNTADRVASEDAVEPGPVYDLDRLLAPHKEALEMSYACLMVGLPQNTDVDYGHRAHLQSFKVIAASVLLKELTELENRMNGGQLVHPTNGDEDAGGGYVGVRSGPAFSYAYNGYDVDVGQYPNYGYSQYL